MPNPVGRPPRIPGAVKVSVWISPGSDELLDSIAFQSKLTRSEIVDRLIENYGLSENVRKAVRRSE